MRTLLDSDVISNLMKREHSARLLERLAELPEADRFVSTITLGEVLYGLERSARHEHLRRVLEEKVLPHLRLVAFDEAAARQYAVLRAHLEREGQPLGEADLRIAAIALANDLTLITGNDKHFRRVPRLRALNWLS